MKVWKDLQEKAPFRLKALRLWNAQSLGDAFDCFKKQLETLLFRQAVSWPGLMTFSF